MKKIAGARCWARCCCNAILPVFKRQEIPCESAGLESEEDWRLCNNGGFIGEDGDERGKKSKGAGGPFYP